MAARVKSNPNRLYDEDFYAWSRQQAALLRDGRFVELDLEHLIEEVEDLGGALKRSVRSRIGTIIEHLLKLDYSGWVEARNHWRAEVDAFRGSIERKITPRIRQQVETELDALYDRARRAAARSLHQREPDFVRRLPKTSPYDWHAIWHRDVLAEAGIDLAEAGIDLADGPEEGKKKGRRERGA